MQAALHPRVRRHGRHLGEDRGGEPARLWRAQLGQRAGQRRPAQHKLDGEQHDDSDHGGAAQPAPPQMLGWAGPWLTARVWPGSTDMTPRSDRF
ncbi:hypothetical protein [Dactylosporangium sp. CA-139066]|uniref:hypothetical protein n=1 Tax=Dactylosporangium sp. CA-139066 TaxID=3239930 RepID=UPI003D8CA274